MVVIREMLTRMESEHKTKLEQLHIMQEQQRFEVFRSVTVILFQNKKKIFLSFIWTCCNVWGDLITFLFIYLFLTQCQITLQKYEYFKPSQSVRGNQESTDLQQPGS